MQEKTYSLRHGCLEIFKKIRYNENIMVRWVMFLAVKYEILLFDADNTLFDFSLAERAAISETMRAFGIVPTEALVCSYSEVNDRMWKMLERGEIHLIGSDCHNLNARPPRIGEAYGLMKKKLGDGFYSLYCEYGYSLLN